MKNNTLFFNPIYLILLFAGYVLYWNTLAPMFENDPAYIANSVKKLIHEEVLVTCQTKYKTSDCNIYPISTINYDNNRWCYQFETRFLIDEKISTKYLVNKNTLKLINRWDFKEVEFCPTS